MNRSNLRSSHTSFYASLRTTNTVGLFYTRLSLRIYPLGLRRSRRTGRTVLTRCLDILGTPSCRSSRARRLRRLCASRILLLLLLLFSDSPWSRGQHFEATAAFESSRPYAGAEKSSWMRALLLLFRRRRAQNKWCETRRSRAASSLSLSLSFSPFRCACKSPVSLTNEHKEKRVI